MSTLYHVAVATHLTLQLEDGTRVLGPIRNPMNIPHIANSALGMLLEAGQLMIKEYRSNDIKNLTRWWSKEIRDTHIKLAEMERSHLEWFYKKFIFEKPTK